MYHYRQILSKSATNRAHLNCQHLIRVAQLSNLEPQMKQLQHSQTCMYIIVDKNIIHDCFYYYAFKVILWFHQRLVQFQKSYETEELLKIFKPDETILFVSILFFVFVSSFYPDSKKRKKIRSTKTLTTSRNDRQVPLTTCAQKSNLKCNSTSKCISTERLTTI